MQGFDLPPPRPIQDSNEIWGYLRTDGTLGLPPSVNPGSSTEAIPQWLQRKGILREQVTQFTGPPSTIKEAADEPLVTMGLPQRPFERVREAGDEEAIEHWLFPDGAVQVGWQQKFQAHGPAVNAQQAQAAADLQALAEAEQAKRDRERQEFPISSAASPATSFRNAATSRPRRVSGEAAAQSRISPATQQIGRQRASKAILGQLLGKGG